MKPEARLRRAVAEQIRASPDVTAVMAGPEWRPDMPLWPRVTGGQLGGFDLAFQLADPDSMNVVAETKWSSGGIDALDEVLWDAFKLAHAVATLDAVTDGFLIYAARTAAWNKPPRYAELFQDGRVESLALINAYPSVWAWLYNGSSAAKPTQVPGALRTSLVAEASFPFADQSWTVRCARVEVDDVSWIEVARPTRN
jgi:hypothetical protein